MLPQQYSEMTDQQARQLCQQLRVQMIQTVSKTGGSNSIVAGRVFDVDEDGIWIICGTRM